MRRPQNEAPPPSERGDGAEASVVSVSDAATVNRLADTGKPDALRCAGCGCAGRKATIVWDRSAPEAQLPVLTVTFGWGDRERAALLCPACRALFLGTKPRRRKRASTKGSLL